MRTNRKISGTENMDKQEIVDKLEYLKELPDELKQDLEELEEDRKDAKKWLVIPCVVYGALIVYQIVMIIINIVNQEFDNILTNITIIMVNTIFISYEILLYKNRIAAIEMYTTNRELLVDWANDMLQGLEREAELTMKLTELKKGQKKAGWHFSIAKFKHLSWIKCAYCGKQINAGDRVCGRNLALTDTGRCPAMRYFCDKECAKKWYESCEPEQEMDVELNAYIKNPPRSSEGEAQQ